MAAGVLPHLPPTFFLALPIPLPPLSADALAPAQSLEKEQRRAGFHQDEMVLSYHRAWGCFPSGITRIQTSNNTLGYCHLIQWLRWH